MLGQDFRVCGCEVDHGSVFANTAVLFEDGVLDNYSRQICACREVRPGCWNVWASVSVFTIRSKELLIHSAEISVQASCCVVWGIIYILVYLEFR